MTKNNTYNIPVSCLCSIYRETILSEFIIAIDSIMIQKYIPNEIVIIVDGYIKKDIKMFLEFIKTDEIFKIYKIKKNKGLGFALNYGLKKCTNSIVARFDTDDINLQNRLKIQYDLIKKNSNLSIIGSNVFEYNEKIKTCKIKKVPLNHKEIFKSYMFRNPINHPTVMFKKDDILKVGSYKNLNLFEDYELWLRCIKNKLMILNIEKPLVAMKRESLLNKRSGTKYINYELNFLKEVLKIKTIKKIYIPFYILRIIMRITPLRLSKLISYLDFNRENSNFDILIEIDNIKKNQFSYSKKYEDSKYNFF
tara:strand:- start:447 stop:1370 length:924 start_codon:yes stop_codon:yes gene_type:complete